MPDHLVLDASAAVAIARGEPTADRIRSIIHDHVAADGEIVVPDHFWLEVINVLVRRYHRNADGVIHAIRELDELDLVTREIDRPLLLLALQSMLSAELTGYDAAYLALAEIVDGRLLTLDDRLAGAAGERAIPHLPEGPARSSEQAAVYGEAARLTDLSAFGAYLAELRRGAEATV
ncbi:MAG: type II toxin-antitoxin system VapC family toxin [Candidatus Limnocylindrales bacterium]